VPDDSPAHLPIGATFHGRYEVLRCIRAGGMGAVYEVLHLETRRRRALKVMLPSLVSDPDLRARFEREATITADIDSEHIVETFDAGVDSATGVPFLVMELLKGDDLATILEARHRLPADEVATLLHQAALALDRTHAAGIVHRDLKPENLFVARRDDGTPRLKILDFGIAKVVASSSRDAKATRSMGTPLFMSPEQVTGDGSIGPRADLYALGHIAYALLVGEPYWQKEARAIEGIYPLLLRIAQGATDRASERAARRGVTLTPAFDEWFARATAALPSGRFARASELTAALAEALGASLPAAPVGTITTVAGETPSDAERASVAAMTTVDQVRRDRVTTADPAPPEGPRDGSEVAAATPVATSRGWWAAAALACLVLGGAAVASRAPSAAVARDTPSPPRATTNAPAGPDGTAAAPPAIEPAPSVVTAASVVAPPDSSAAPSATSGAGRAAPEGPKSATSHAPPPILGTSRPAQTTKLPKEARDPTLVR
jgi:serine/threonine-protein kinase